MLWLPCLYTWGTLCSQKDIIILLHTYLKAWTLKDTVITAVEDKINIGCAKDRNGETRN